MTLEIFKAHKQGIREAMNSALIMSKYKNTPLHSYTTYSHIEVISIHKELEGEELLHQLDRVKKLASKPNTTLVQRGQTKVSGRYDIFHSVDYIVTTELFRDRITEEQIEDAMKTLVKKAMGLASYEYLNCQVMAIYKRGEITWDEAVQAHKEDCSL